MICQSLQYHQTHIVNDTDDSCLF